MSKKCGEIPKQFHGNYLENFIPSYFRKIWKKNEETWQKLKKN